MQNLYTIKSEKERIGLNKLFSKIYKGEEGLDFYKYVTPAEGMDCYDGGGGILSGPNKWQRHIFEVKVRDTHYPELMLEKPKLESLLKKAKEFDAIVFYVSITPEGCFVFRLKSSALEYEWKREMHWVSTTDKSRGKKLKSITYIPQEEAKLFKDINREMIESEYEESIKPKVELKKKCKCGLEVFFDTKK